GGDVVGCGIAEEAMRRGGHVQVGLEPYGGPGTPANVDLVRAAAAVAAKVGRPVATIAEARRIIGIADAGR
ncbi:MAG TPA: 3-keto-5-aminohexanoate cleavage protein, partial [Dehalococcoidia bacterium]|nr:3-keto-5-aminohexanoate cleavage protein [Dehalococcoidia bacterium]